jgi:glycosyltransferase involved in cell wall biosynthesis
MTPPRGPVTVLFLETSMRIGGTETVLTQLIQRIDRRRFRPILCCLYEPGVLAQPLIDSGATVIHGLAGGRWSLTTGWRLWRLLRRERVQVLFMVNQPLVQFWGTLCGILAGVPVRLAAIRSTGKINRIQRRLLVNRLTFPLTTRVTALSQTHKRYLIEHEQIAADKLEIITNGVDLARFANGRPPQAVREQLGVGASDPLVGIVAMLRPEKAHDVFLRAAAVAAKCVPSAQFVIVGDGPERARLEALAKSLNLNGHARFVGARSDVPEVVRALDVAVLSSHPVVETLSNAVLEYMAAGKPVVATRVGSVPEQVEHGVTGFLVDPGDWQTLGDRIAELLEDRALAARMGQAGRARVEERYTIDRMVQGHEHLFERLLAQ